MGCCHSSADVQLVGVWPGEGSNPSWGKWKHPTSFGLSNIIQHTGEILSHKGIGEDTVTNIEKMRYISMGIDTVKARTSMTFPQTHWCDWRYVHRPFSLNQWYIPCMDTPGVVHIVFPNFPLSLLYFLRLWWPYIAVRFCSVTLFTLLGWGVPCMPSLLFCNGINNSSQGQWSGACFTKNVSHFCGSLV